MHPLRKLRESGKPTPAQVSALLAENIVFNSPILVRPIEGREVIAAIFAQSSTTRGSGTYIPESGVKIAISDLDRLQSVNLAQDVIGQIL